MNDLISSYTVAMCNIDNINFLSLQDCRIMHFKCIKPGVHLHFGHLVIRFYFLA